MMKAWLKDKALDFLDDLKRAHKSLTIWFNAAVASATSMLLALPMEQVIAYMPQFQPYLEDARFRNIMLVLVAVNGVNMMLRFKTTKAMRHK